MKDSAIIRFNQQFRDKFKEGFPRWSAFQFIADRLYKLGSPTTIIETGCVRTTDDWAGNGQSTLLWDWIAGETGGRVISIDINQNNCELAKKQTKNTTVINNDSIHALRTLSAVGNADLLYLDSYDWSADRQAVSALHHVGELAAAWERLRSGCLIAVDDCHAANTGKHVLVQEFFSLAGRAPVHIGYVMVWEK